MESHRSNRVARAAAALALFTAALAPAAVRAQSGVVVVPAAPPPPPRARPDAVPVDENTARMIGAGRLKLGILAFEYSPVELFSFGTDPPAWALRGLADVLVPNVHVKFQLVNTPRLLVAAMGAGYWAHISTDAAKGELLVVPGTLYVSYQLAPPLWVHVEGAYNWARGFGSGDVSKPDIDGAVVMTTAQVGAMFEYRISRVVGLFARGRFQPYASPIVLEGSGMLDAYTTAEGALEIRTPTPHPIMGVAGVELTWKYIGVIAGGGYGNYFLPGLNVSDPHTSFVPEASLWALF